MELLTINGNCILHLQDMICSSTRWLYGFQIKRVNSVHELVFVPEADQSWVKNLERLRYLSSLSHMVSCLQCFGGIASEADSLLNELQCSLAKQEERLAHFANKQREVCILWKHRIICCSPKPLSVITSVIGHRDTWELWRHHGPSLRSLLVSSTR